MSNQSETKHWDVWCEFNGVVALSVTAGVMDNYDRKALQAMLMSQQPQPLVIEALETISRLHDHEKSTPELAQNMYSARCVALSALRVINGEDK